MDNTDIKLREATFSDISQLKHLWHTNFGDSYEYIDFFMKERFASTRTLIAESSDKLLGALYLMKVSTVDGVENKQGYYLYGLSVDKRFRSMGIGSRLVKLSCEIAKNENGFIILCPAEESLVNYYRKLGFVENAYITEKIIAAKKRSFSPDLKELDALKFIKLRNKNFENMIFWDQTGLEYILKENLFSNGSNLYYTYSNKEFFLLCRKIKNEVIVLESNIPDEHKDSVSDYLSTKYNTSIIKWIIPHNPDVNSVLYGMTFGLPKDNYYFNHILN